MAVNGFRGVNLPELILQSPITVLSGVNGTGKSTIAQLAVCAYSRDSAGEQLRFYVKDYFPVSVMDPKPFVDQATVRFEYAAPPGLEPQKVTTSRSAKNSWTGYKRQPPKSVFYVGLTHFLPKVERKDMSVYAGARISIDNVNKLDDTIRKHLSGVIGKNYSNAELLDITLNRSSTTIARVTHANTQYSENHMGFGEGRMFYLVSLLEKAPLKSLIIIEEPETSLHGHAQQRLARYLVDVSNRRGHQIIMTSHSAAIMNELNRESIVYLKREADGSITSATGLSTYQIDSYLHDSEKNNAAICVEDVTAEILLSEVLRVHDPHLLSGTHFRIVGAGQDIPNVVKTLRDSHVRAVGVSDADFNHEGKDFTMSMPGKLAPEKEIFAHPSVRSYFAEKPYSSKIEDLLSTVDDHHEYARKISKAVNLREDAVLAISCKEFVNAQPEGYFTEIVSFIKKSLGDRK